MSQVKRRALDARLGGARQQSAPAETGVAGLDAERIVGRAHRRRTRDADRGTFRDGRGPGTDGFLAYNSANDAAQSSGATIDVDTEVYDNTANFSADTFTAPVTGTYHLCATVRLVPNASANAGPDIVTSNRRYVIYQVSATTDTVAHTGCVLADMDASDTATVQLFLSTSTATIIGTAAPNMTTFFSGRLVP
jgi:hypothetical protein